MNAKRHKYSYNILALLPLILVLDIPFIVYVFKYGSWDNYAAVLISILIPFLLQAVLNLKLWQFVLVSIPVLYLTLSFDVLIFDFNSYYNISTWSAVFDTNPEESKEFLGILRTVTWVTGLFQILTWLLYAGLSFKIKLQTYPFKFRILAGGLLILIVADWFRGGPVAQAYPFGHTLHSFLAYQQQSELEQKLWKKKHTYIYNATENQEFVNDTLPKTIVVLITESLRRDHQSIYGYRHETTPLMQTENLVLYTDVISPANQTVNSLRRVFSQAEGNNDTLYFAKPTVIKAFNEAGYQTAWYSTQSVGKNGESKNSVIAKECDTAVFRNNTFLDTILLQDLKNELKKETAKKLIFLHVFGVHYLYDHRFAEGFEKFSKQKTTDFKQDQINKYDDAIRYNDFLQSEILKLLKQQKGEKVFITFSDHGESLFDSAPYIQGHGALQPARVEFDVPFVLWFSKEYRQQHPNIYNNVLKNKDLPAINSDFFYSFPYLFGIEFDELKPEKNFFGNKYNHKQKRWVVNSALDLLDYDKLPYKR